MLGLPKALGWMHDAEAPKRKGVAWWKAGSDCAVGNWHPEEAICGAEGSKVIMAQAKREAGMLGTHVRLSRHDLAMKLSQAGPAGRSPSRRYRAGYWDGVSDRVRSCHVGSNFSGCLMGARDFTWREEVGEDGWVVGRGKEEGWSGGVEQAY